MPDPLDALSDADLEALSALLDGDLTTHQADALRERVRCEPALAAGYHALAALPAALAGLPADVAPPRHLDAAVVAARFVKDKQRQPLGMLRSPSARLPARNGI